MNLQVVQKWGNSLALRIPKVFATSSKISEGSLVNLAIENGKIIIEPFLKNKYSLKDLLEKINDDNIHHEIDTGTPIGREIW